MRHGLRVLDGFRDWRSCTELRGERREEVFVTPYYSSAAAFIFGACFKDLGGLETRDMYIRCDFNFCMVGLYPV